MNISNIVLFFIAAGRGLFRVVCASGQQAKQTRIAIRPIALLAVAAKGYI